MIFRGFRAFEYVLWQKKENPETPGNRGVCEMVSGQFPDGRIPEGHFPDGHFPDQTLPRRTLSRRTLPRRTYSPTRHIPDGRFPKQINFFYSLFDCNIFPNCNFYLHS